MIIKSLDYLNLIKSLFAIFSLLQILYFIFDPTAPNTKIQMIFEYGTERVKLPSFLNCSFYYIQVLRMSKKSMNLFLHIVIFDIRKCMFKQILVSVL